MELTKQNFNRFYFEDPVLINVQILNPENVISGENRSIGPSASLFPNLISNEQIQGIDTEWREIQCLDLNKFDGENADFFLETSLVNEKRRWKHCVFVFTSFSIYF